MFKCYPIIYHSEKDIILHDGPPPTQQLRNVLMPSLDSRNVNLPERQKWDLPGFGICVERRRQHPGRVNAHLKVRVVLSRKCFPWGTWGRKKDEWYSKTCQERWFVELLCLRFSLSPSLLLYPPPPPHTVEWTLDFPANVFHLQVAAKLLKAMTGSWRYHGYSNQLQHSC